MIELAVKTTQKRQVIDITDRLNQALKERGYSDGWLRLWLAHTTAALASADLDPGTDLDLLDALGGLLPDRRWRHPHDPDHTPDHLLSTIIGPGLVVPCLDGRLKLGQWQRIVLVELDGPRQRQLWLGFDKAIESA